MGSICSKMSLKEEWWQEFRPLLLPVKGINSIIPIDIVAQQTYFFEKILEMLTLAINKNEMWLFQDCSEHLAQFLKLRLIMNKPIFIRLANICWNLIIFSPFDNPHFRSGWANILIELLKYHKKSIEKQDLQFAWKPLYDIIVQYLFPLPRSGVTPAESSMTIPLVKLTRFVRRYFHSEAALEILQELKPILNPIDDQMTKALALLSRFIPSDTIHVTEILEIVKPDSILWSSTLSKNESFLINLICRIARKNIGEIDWSEWSPFLFRLLSNHLSLPRNCSQRVLFNLSGSQAKRYGEPEPPGDQVFRDLNHSFLHAFSKWVICAITDPSSNSNQNDKQDHVLNVTLTFLKSHETFFHPSNNGGWSPKLASLILSLIGRLARRQTIESIALSNSQTMIEEFLKYLWKLVFMLLLSKNPAVVVSACSSARYLANLNPNIMLNDAKDFIFDSMDLDMPHRTTAAFGLVASIARTCSNWTKFPYGPSTAISYLISAIPGIDPNDECKCALALGLIGDFASNLPLFNFPTLLHTDQIAKLSDYQNAFVESTASLESFLLLYLEQCLNYIRSISHSSVSFKSGGFFGSLEIPRILIIVSNVLFMQISEDYHGILLEKIFTFIRENVYIHASEFTAHFVSAIKGRFIEKTLKLLLPWCFERLNILKDSIMATNDLTFESSIQEPIWIFHIIIRLVQNIGLFIIPHLNSLEDIFMTFSKCPNRKIRDLAGKVYRSIFKSLALIYCIEWTSWDHQGSISSDSEFSQPLSLRTDSSTAMEKKSEEKDRNHVFNILEQTGKPFHSYEVVPVWYTPSSSSSSSINTDSIMRNILDRSIKDLGRVNQELSWLNRLYFILKAYKIYEESLPLKDIKFENERLYGVVEDNEFQDKFKDFIDSIINLDSNRSAWTKEQNIQLLKIIDTFLLYEANPRKGLFLDNSDSDIPVAPKEKTRPRIYHILKAEKRLLAVSDCRWSLLCNRPQLINKLGSVLVEYICNSNDDISEKAENILKDLDYALYNDRIKDVYLIMNNKILDSSSSSSPSLSSIEVSDKVIDSILGFLTCPETIELACTNWSFAADLFQFLLKISERKDKLKSIEEVNVVWELLKITPVIFCTPSIQSKSLEFTSDDFGECKLSEPKIIENYMESIVRIFDLTSMEYLQNSWNNSMVLNLILAIVSRHLKVHHEQLDAYLFKSLSNDAEILVQSSSIVLIGRLLVGHVSLSQDRSLVQSIITKFTFTILNNYNSGREFERHYAVIIELLSLYYGKWFVEFILSIQMNSDTDPMAIQNTQCILLAGITLAIIQWNDREEQPMLYSKLFSFIDSLWSKSISTCYTAWYCCFKYATSLKLPFAQYEPIVNFVLNAFVGGEGKEKEKEKESTTNNIMIIDNSPSNRILSIIQSIQGMVSNLWKDIDLSETINLLIELSKNHSNDSIKIEASSSILDLVWTSFIHPQLFKTRVELMKEITRGDHRLSRSLLLQSIVEPLICGITEIVPDLLTELFGVIENSKTEYEKETKKIIEACNELQRCSKSVIDRVLSTTMEYANDPTRKVPSRQIALAFAWLFYERNFIFYFEGRDELLTSAGNLLRSNVLEVREEASFFLQSIFRTYPSDGDRSATTIKINLHRSISSIGNPENLIERHAVVLSACSLILSSPYSIPHWLPSILRLLTYYISDRMPISGNVRKMFNEFKRTHQDNWAAERMLFSEEELGAISELLIGPSYYA